MPAPQPAPPSLYDLVMDAASHAPPPDAPRERPGARTPHDGSVTSRVLLVLIERHPRWHEHYELMRLTGASRGAIAWAVRYLQNRGLVRSIPSNRNPQYRRYQATKPADPAS